MDRHETTCEAIVVSHTHWDREWYLPHEEFRYWLIQALDRLLEIFENRPDYRFMLDGQIVPLLDYLAIRPEKEPELRELVRAGRLSVGPWYIQPDEFLVSGEGLIRNLLRGHRVAQRFGGTMKDGYVPDCFGHIAQLPQILRGFDIETAFLVRGADLVVEEVGAAEFLWQAPNGARVLTHVMGMGYCAGALLSPDPSAASPFQSELVKRGMMPADAPAFLALLQSLQAMSSCGAVLIPNGCDHLGPQEEVLDVLRILNDRLPGIRLRQGTLSEFANLVRTCHPRLSVVEGELRAGKRHPILNGVYSTRIYIKQKNSELETLLVRYAEPLAAFARLLGHDLTPFIKTAWELMLLNQAHDSICGTSIDAVHREMMVRYERAEAIIRQVIRGALETIGRHIKSSSPGETGTEILVFNPCPWERKEEVTVGCDIEEDPAGYTLLDPDGQPVPLVVLGKRLSSEDILNGVKHRLKAVMAFPVDLPPFGLKLYRLTPGELTREPGSLVVNEHTLENEFYRVEVEPTGTLSILDKETGDRYQGLCFLEDTGDAGDEYNYSPPARQETVTSLQGQAKVRAVERLPWKGTLKVDLSLRLPKGLLENRRARSRERVDYPITLFVSLQRGLKRVDIFIELENFVRDHRLRAGFPAGFKAEHSIAEDAFWVIRRPVRTPTEHDWVEDPPTTHPQKSFVAVENGEKGIAVLNRGLPEYEVTEEGVIYITLLRGVGWLSRDDLSTRKGHAGPPYETPEAQCLGRHRFELAVYTYRGTWEEARVWEVAHAFRALPLGVEVVRGQGGNLPPEASLFQIEPAGIVLSAVKAPEEGDGLIVRVYNPTGHPVLGTLKSLWTIEKAELTNLNEETLEPIPVRSSHAIPVSLDGGAIKTFRLWLKPRQSDTSGLNQRGEGVGGG